MPCPTCGPWTRDPSDTLSDHHRRCPLGPALAPSKDGSCHCGATLFSPGLSPCLFCGGYTAARLEQAKAAAAALDGEATSPR